MKKWAAICICIGACLCANMSLIARAGDCDLDVTRFIDGQYFNFGPAVPVHLQIFDATHFNWKAFVKKFPINLFTDGYRFQNFVNSQRGTFISATTLHNPKQIALPEHIKDHPVGLLYIYDSGASPLWKAAPEEVRGQKCARVAWIEIVKGYRGKRIAAHMLTEAAKWAKQEGFKFLTADVVNAASKHALERFGFRKDWTRRMPIPIEGNDSPEGYVYANGWIMYYDLKDIKE